MASINAGKAKNPQYLVLGSMPEEANPQTHVAASEWCFLEREALFPDWESSFEMAPDYRPEPEEDLFKNGGWIKRHKRRVMNISITMHLHQQRRLSIAV